MSYMQEAVAAEIRAEMASRKPRITGRDMHKRLKISQASFTNYFVSVKRDVPFDVIVRACEVLDVSVTELMRRAEERAGDLAAQHDAAAERGLSNLPPDLADRVRRVDREGSDAQEDDPQSSERLTRPDRSAMTG